MMEHLGEKGRRVIEGAQRRCEAAEEPENFPVNEWTVSQSPGTRARSVMAQGHTRRCACVSARPARGLSNRNSSRHVYAVLLHPGAACVCTAVTLIKILYVYRVHYVHLFFAVIPNMLFTISNVPASRRSRFRACPRRSTTRPTAR